MAKKRTTRKAAAAIEPEVVGGADQRADGGDPATFTGTTIGDPVAQASDSEPRQSEPSYEEIAAAAYRRYLSRGGGDGQDFEDWLEAERELRSRR